MKRKTAQQLLRLVINGVGLKTTLEIIGRLVMPAGIAEDIEHTDDDSRSSLHAAAECVWAAAKNVHNDDLDGFRVTAPKEN